MSKINFPGVVFLLEFFFTTDVFSVQSCNLSTPSLVFPNYDSFQSQSTTATGIITISCTENAPISYRLTLSAGHGTSFNPRYLANGHYKLNYNLYYNAFPPNGIIWGNGSGGSHPLIKVNVNCYPSCQDVVYGSIPGSQNVAPGVYTATIQLILFY